MKANKYKVKIYHSSFCTYEVEAENENDAITKARKLPPNNNEMFSNLETWEEADTANKME